MELQIWHGLAQVVEVKAAIEGIADGVHGARRIPGKARLLSSCASSAYKETFMLGL